MKNWAQETWMITGTSSGFGREIARSVLAQGGRVVATARKPKSLQSLVAQAPERVLSLAVDVENPQQVARAVDSAVARFGAVDVLVNNAGYGLIGAVEQLPDADVRQLFEVNFFGLVAMTRALLPHMRQRKHGFIVNMSSAAGLGGHPGSAFYCASKFAVEGFTEALRAEIAPSGIGAMAVEPGFFKTEFGQNAQLRADVLPEYQSTVGVTAKMMAMMKGREPGDPARAATAIINAMNHSSPPGQLVLGAGAHERITARMAERLASIREWREQALGADFPS
jgi:NAD(P)-dependent dehydrogenase (short-subunit alcohol dehydrogenase family)